MIVWPDLTAEEQGRWLDYAEIKIGSPWPGTTSTRQLGNTG